MSETIGFTGPFPQYFRQSCFGIIKIHAWHLLQRLSSIKRWTRKAWNLKKKISSSLFFYFPRPRKWNIPSGRPNSNVFRLIGQYAKFPLRARRRGKAAVCVYVCAWVGLKRTRRSNDARSVIFFAEKHAYARLTIFNCRRNEIYKIISRAWRSQFCSVWNKNKLNSFLVNVEFFFYIFLRLIIFKTKIFVLCLKVVKIVLNSYYSRGIQFISIYNNFYIIF